MIVLERPFHRYMYCSDLTGSVETTSRQNYEKQDCQQIVILKKNLDFHFDFFRCPLKSRGLRRWG